MRRPMVLVSLEPRCYREAIGGALALRRPGLEVRVVEPDETEGLALGLRPRLVLSASPDGSLDPDSGTLWVQLVFGPEQGVRLRLGDGPETGLSELDLEDLLEIVDGAAGPSRVP